MNRFKKVISFLSLTFLFLSSSRHLIAATLVGDINTDGKVDIIDIGIVIDNYATSPIANIGADINSDGTVDIIDIGIVIDNYGRTGLVVNPTPTSTQTSSGVPCNLLSGIELRFPCLSFAVGSMPEQPTSGTGMWSMFTNILYTGAANGANERFSAVANPAGSGAVVRNQNLLSDAEQHTTVGTSRDLPNGSTECSAFRWLWKNAAELPQRGWLLVWQQQQLGSPIVAISTDQTSHNWFFKTRNGSDTGLDINLTPILYNRWVYFVVCTHIADAPNGSTKIWFSYDMWPDVNAEPFYQRIGHDTYQGSIGHNTIGIYAEHDGSPTSYYGYFDRYGRATTPQRAVAIAGN